MIVLNSREKDHAWFIVLKIKQGYFLAVPLTSLTDKKVIWNHLIAIIG